MHWNVVEWIRVRTVLDMDRYAFWDVGYVPTLEHTISQMADVANYSPYGVFHVIPNAVQIVEVYPFQEYTQRNRPIRTLLNLSSLRGRVGFSGCGVRRRAPGVCPSSELGVLSGGLYPSSYFLSFLPSSAFAFAAASFAAPAFFF